MSYVSVYVGRVEVDLGEIDIDDLVAEVRRRGPAAGVSATPALGSEEAHPLHEIFYAMKFGLTDRALELTRVHVCEELGVVL